MARYIWEWTWSGYHSGQARICHREVLTLSEKRLEKYKNLNCIQFGDGTTMSANIRAAKPRERVEQIKGYHSLIRDALYSGKSYYTV